MSRSPRPLPMAIILTPKFRARLESKISKMPTTEGCLLWIPTPSNAKRYPMIGIGMATFLVSRIVVALQLQTDFLEIVRHTCDRPACCNINHLIRGSHKENMQDMLDRGRQFQRNITHCKHGHEYTERNTGFKKNRYGRYCKECRRLRFAERFKDPVVREWHRNYCKDYYLRRKRGET